MSNKSFLVAPTFSEDVKGELVGFTSDFCPNENWPKEGFTGSEAVPPPKENEAGTSVFGADPNNVEDPSGFGNSVLSGFAKKLKEFAVSGVEVEKPPNPANTFFFSPPSAGALLRAVLMTRTFSSLSLA